MKTILLFLFFLSVQNLFAQNFRFTTIQSNAATPVKNQGNSGTCWCYSSTAMTESELLKKKQPEMDLSETFTVYNLYIDKAEKYMRRKGDTRFAEGGLGQDMLYAIDNFGAMPQSVYPGIGRDTVMKNDYAMQDSLKHFLDSMLRANPDSMPLNWEDQFKAMLSHNLGMPPQTFSWYGKTYTSKSFAAEFVNTKLTDFIGLTSFTHHPYYTSFVMEVQDNYNSNAYYNLPLEELIATVKTCIQNGYTLTWDADVSNAGFQQRKGVAMWVNNESERTALPLFAEQYYDATIRQHLFDNLTTQDDHLMQITGLAKDDAGKEYFIVKNSWGKEAGPYHGYIYVSLPYFAINTISVLVNKKALPAALDNKLLASDNR